MDAGVDRELGRILIAVVSIPFVMIIGCGLQVYLDKRKRKRKERKERLARNCVMPQEPYFAPTKPVSRYEILEREKKHG